MKSGIQSATDSNGGVSRLRKPEKLEWEDDAIGVEGILPFLHFLYNLRGTRSGNRAQHQATGAHVSGGWLGRGGGHHGGERLLDGHLHSELSGQGGHIRRGLGWCFGRAAGQQEEYDNERNLFQPHLFMFGRIVSIFANTYLSAVILMRE
jgi:hypothetical protein